MSRLLQVYYSAVLGGLGGLLGWWVMGSLPTSAWGIWVAYPVVGGGLGFWIGGCLAATDGAVVKRLVGRAVRDGVVGAVAGGVAGVVGLLVAEVWFLGVGGGFGGRVIGWMVLGGFLGLGDLLVNRQVRRAVYGALGGLLGGLLGGAGYEGLTQVFLAQSDRVQVVIGGVGLVVLGACIGGCVPLARQVFSHGLVRVLSGGQEGLVREVTDVASIGRYDGCDVYLPDQAVAWRHAVVRRGAQGFVFEVQAGTTGAVVDERPLGPGESLALRGGERIWLGETVLVFEGR